MKLKDLKNDICLLVAGNINEEMDYEKITLTMEHNESVFNEFGKIVFVLNSHESSNSREAEKVVAFLKLKFPESVILFDFANRGHQIGHVDLDKIGFFYIKNNLKSMKYTFKLSIDILVKDILLNLNIDEDTDFFYQPSINLVDYQKYNDIYYREFTKDNFSDGLCPQTIFYMLSNKVDFPYEKNEVIDKNYDDWIRRGYKGVDQKLVLACEHSLNKSIIRNKFKRQSMIDESTFYKIINYMISTNNSDCTLKNIYIPEIGVCHWQYKNKETLTCAL